MRRTLEVFRGPLGDRCRSRPVYIISNGSTLRYLFLRFSHRIIRRSRPRRHRHCIGTSPKYPSRIGRHVTESRLLSSGQDEPPGGGVWHPDNQKTIFKNINKIVIYTNRNRPNVPSVWVLQTPKQNISGESILWGTTRVFVKIILVSYIKEAG